MDYLSIELSIETNRRRKIDRTGCDTDILWNNNSYGSKEVGYCMMSDIYDAYNEYVSDCAM